MAFVVLAGSTATVLLTLRPPAPLITERQRFVFSGVTVVNPGTGRQVDQRLTIHGSVVESISDGTASASESSNTHRYPGSYVLPGLVDLHVHQPPARAVADTRMFALLYLSHGVTSKLIWTRSSISRE